MRVKTLALPQVIYVTRGDTRRVVHAMYTTGLRTLCGQIRNVSTLKVTSDEVNCRMCRMLVARINWHTEDA